MEVFRIVTGREDDGSACKSCSRVSMGIAQFSGTRLWWCTRERRKDGSTHRQSSPAPKALRQTSPPETKTVRNLQQKLPTKSSQQRYTPLRQHHRRRTHCEAGEIRRRTWTGFRVCVEGEVGVFGMRLIFLVRRCGL